MMLAIDLTAFRCPVPLVKVKLLLKQMEVGEQLRVVVADAGSRQDVPRFLIKMGYEIVILHDDTSQLAFYITKVAT